MLRRYSLFSQAYDGSPIVTAGEYNVANMGKASLNLFIITRTSCKLQSLARVSTRTALPQLSLFELTLNKLVPIQHSASRPLREQSCVGYLLCNIVDRVICYMFSFGDRGRGHGGTMICVEGGGHQTAGGNEPLGPPLATGLTME